jgi:mRNA-degrading endonuclease toxin of MazEF toxin-antitoxin module
MNSSDSLKSKKDFIPTIAVISKSEIIGTPKKLNSLKEDGYILASDIYTIPKNTLRSFIGHLLPSSFYKVDNALMISLGIEIKD